MKQINKLVFAGMLFCLAPLSTVGAENELSPAGTRVKETVTKIQALVRAEKGTVPEDQLKKKVEDLVRPVFDFDEMSKRSLGASWQTASAEERKEFVDLFSKLLADTYIKKVIQGVEKNEVSYDKEDVEEARALLRTEVSGEDGMIKVDYRMRNRSGDWVVYDVIIENVGLVNNYRNEFASIVRSEGMQGLLRKLREKKVAPPPTPKAEK